MKTAVDSQSKIPSLAIVVPCYNEQEMFEKTLAVLIGLTEKLIAINKISSQSKIYFVDDGSADRTWSLLEESCTQYHQVVAIKLSRNRGHQNALYAGLCETKEDLIVSIDADLQDGPENIEYMVDEHKLGNEIVYGVRNKRDSDTLFKRFTAESFYRVMDKLGVDLVFNHADFRLMSRRALNSLLTYPESNLFLRGMVKKIGFQSSSIEYERQAREAGESKYPLKKMIALAWNGITSFSTAPLRAITFLGMLSSFLSLWIIAWVVGIKLFTDNAVPGWASILVPLVFIGSVQLLCLGVIGEYLAKVYDEVKRRPRYQIDKISGR